MKNRKKLLKNLHELHALHGNTNQQIILRISPARIAFLRFIFEGYDGLAIVSTIDAGEGIVRVWYPPTSARAVVELLNDLAGELT